MDGGRGDMQLKVLALAARQAGMLLCAVAFSTRQAGMLSWEFYRQRDVFVRAEAVDAPSIFLSSGAVLFKASL